jgi:hypothetical protein
MQVLFLQERLPETPIMFIKEVALLDHSHAWALLRDACVYPVVTRLHTGSVSLNRRSDAVFLRGGQALVEGAGQRVVDSGHAWSRGGWETGDAAKHERSEYLIIISEVSQ